MKRTVACRGGIKTLRVLFTAVGCVMEELSQSPDGVNNFFLHPLVVPIFDSRTSPLLLLEHTRIRL